LWVVPFALWNVRSWPTLVMKVRLFMVQYRAMIMAGMIAIAIAAIQPLYWKATTGYFRYHGYDERFSFLSPFFYECFLSYKKGWLVYTPLVLFMFTGFVFLWKQRREIFWPLLILLLLHCWFIMSWETWWYASSFSLRGAVELYPALAIPLGCLVVAISRSPRAIRFAGATALTGVVFLNLFQHWQFNHGIIDGERMSKSYYWRVFGKTAITADDLALLEVDRHPNPEVMPADQALIRTDSYLLAFEQEKGTSPNEVTALTAHSGNRSLRIDSSYAFGPMYSRNFHGNSEEYAWVRATAWISLSDSTQLPPELIISFHARGRDLRSKSVQLDTNGIRRGEWRLLTADMITPISLYPDDEIRCVIWNPDGRAIYLDDFQVEIYEPQKQLR
jgi:hypothetical protein